MVAKTAWYWHKNWHTGQWNRTGKPEVTHLQPTAFWQRHQKDAGERPISLINDFRKTGNLYAEEWNLTSISHHIKKNPEWIKDINVRPETARKKHKGNTHKTLS